MKNRHEAREEALQILYQMELNRELTPDAGISLYSDYFSRGNGTDPFAERLVRGVGEKIKEIDELIQKTSEHWRPGRMGTIERNCLRLGIFELSYCDDIPATVTIDEMVEFAKNFGEKDSAGFVNGILDKIRKGLDLSKKVP